MQPNVIVRYIKQQVYTLALCQFLKFNLLLIKLLSISQVAYFAPLPSTENLPSRSGTNNLGKE